MLVPFEHVKPERLDLLDVPALTIHRNSSKRKSFGEIAFKTNLLGIRAFSFVLHVFT